MVYTTQKNEFWGTLVYSKHLMFVVVYQRFARWTARQQCVTNSWTSLWLIFAKHVIPGMMNVDEPKCLMMCLQLGCNQFSARHPTRVAENCFRFLISFWFLLYVKICRRFWQCFLVFYAFVRLFWWFGHEGISRQKPTSRWSFLCCIEPMSRLWPKEVWCAL